MGGSLWLLFCVLFGVWVNLIVALLLWLLVCYDCVTLLLIGDMIVVVVCYVVVSS